LTVQNWCHPPGDSLVYGTAVNTFEIQKREGERERERNLTSRYGHKFWLEWTINNMLCISRAMNLKKVSLGVMKWGVIAK